MSYSVVARRTGLPVMTVQRILTGAFCDPSFPKVAAIAKALGVSLEPREVPVRELREQQARMKAKWIIRMVQGTSGLEGQAVDEDALTLMEDQTFHELMAGSGRKLWGD